MLFPMPFTRTLPHSPQRRLVVPGPVMIGPFNVAAGINTAAVPSLGGGIVFSFRSMRIPQRPRLFGSPKMLLSQRKNSVGAFVLTSPYSHPLGPGGNLSTSISGLMSMAVSLFAGTK